MTGYEIAEKLRQLNRWRRGDDETLLMPDPAAIGRWIDAAADALELRDNRAARVAELEATTLARAESTAPKEVLP